MHFLTKPCAPRVWQIQQDTNKLHMRESCWNTLTSRFNNFLKYCFLHLTKAITSNCIQAQYSPTAGPSSSSAAYPSASYSSYPPASTSFPSTESVPENITSLPLILGDLNFPPPASSVNSAGVGGTVVDACSIQSNMGSSSTVPGSLCGSTENLAVDMPSVDQPPVSQAYNTSGVQSEQFQSGEKEEERMEQYDAEALAETYFDLARMESNSGGQ